MAQPKAMQSKNHPVHGGKSVKLDLLGQPLGPYGSTAAEMLVDKALAKRPKPKPAVEYSNSWGE